MKVLAPCLSLFSRSKDWEKGLEPYLWPGLSPFEAVSVLFHCSGALRAQSPWNSLSCFWKQSDPACCSSHECPDHWTAAQLLGSKQAVRSFRQEEEWKSCEHFGWWRCSWARDPLVAAWGFLKTAVNQTSIIIKGTDRSEMLPGQLWACYTCWFWLCP